MNKKLVIGNWKMNPATLGEAKHIAKKIREASLDLEHVDVVIAPPFLYIAPCTAKILPKNVSMGAQSVSRDIEGAHTGEVSAKMLKDLGVEYVILGHSEERSRGETSEVISKKITTTLESGLRPVVCIGEKDRDLERGSHYDFLKEQINETFANVPKKYAKDIVLAYEPVWAIGAAEPMTSDLIYEMVLFVRKVFSDIFDPKVALKVPVLYGGSVNFKNASDIMITGKVDGLLVGRESVNVTGFVELLKVVDGVE
jgi:triosephosphate isomerase